MIQADHVGAFFESAPQEDQARFEIVLELGQLQAWIKPDFPVREFLPVLLDVQLQQLLKDAPMISGLKHVIVGVWSGAWEGGAVTSVETTVTYLRKDATVTDAIPVTSTLRMRGDSIADFRVFADISPVFATAGGGGRAEAQATASLTS